MPTKINSNVTLYGIDIETGEIFEIPQNGIANIKEIEGAMNATRESDNMWLGDEAFTVTVTVTNKEIIEFVRRFFPDKINNYRRLHGMKPLRKKHFFSKRWYGK